MTMEKGNADIDLAPMQVIEEIRAGDAVFVDSLGRLFISDRAEAARRATEKGLALFQPVFANPAGGGDAADPSHTVGPREMHSGA
jgi:hypothetical protein